MKKVFSKNQYYLLTIQKLKIDLIGKMTDHDEKPINPAGDTQVMIDNGPT